MFGKRIRIVTAFACIVLAVLAVIAPRYDESTALKSLLATGVTIERLDAPVESFELRLEWPDSYPFVPCVWTKSGVPEWLRSLLGDRAATLFDSVGDVDLAACDCFSVERPAEPIVPGACEHLLRLRNIETLRAYDTEFTGDELAALRDRFPFMQVEIVPWFDFGSNPDSAAP